MPPKKPTPSKPGAPKITSKTPTKKEATSTGTDSKTKVEDKPKPLPVVEISLKDLPNALSNDSTKKIVDSGRWPLVIDTAGRTPTFLKYQNVNFLNAVSPEDMAAERVRKAIIGAMRYGKPLVIDMMEGDHLEVVKDAFDQIQPGCADMVMDKSILKDDNYKKLVRANDDKDYHDEYWSPEFLDNFKLILVTTLASPADITMCQMIVFEVK